jgi:DNA sulfur modification protein DndC
MVKNGHDNLEPLFEFRNWLSKFRDDPNFRCKVRRNGKKGLGPITLNGRKMILEKLMETQEISGLALIEKEEIMRINELWLYDKNNLKYREN